MCLRLTDAAIFAVAFGAEPQSIAITADPATAVDAHAVRAFARLPLELIEQDEVAHCPVVHRVTLDVRERRLSGLLRHGRDERRQLAWPLGRLGRRSAWAWTVLLMAGVRIGLRQRRRCGREQKASDGREQVGSVTPRHSSTRTSRNMPASM